VPTRKRRALHARALVLLIGAATGSTFAQGDATRGQYLVKAGGCVACHTERKEVARPLAGGRALATPFGTFYGPNITPHPDAGIGQWTEADFVRAMREGKRPDGANYFPAFPYTSFTGITDGDLRDVWAYLRTVPPSARPNQAHDLRFPFGWRFLVSMWRWLYFAPGPFVPDPRAAPSVNRGAYLVQALGHCGECHTPRNFLGGANRDRHLAGGKGPDGKRVPNLTPNRLKSWSDDELKEVLITGITPAGDIVAETMAEVVRNTTSQLTPSDLDALVAYLRALPPIADAPR
jgi:mono/diheme cytochrome c family protein